VDQFNRFATGPHNISEVWTTNKVWTRLFAFTLSAIEVNGYFAFTKLGPLASRSLSRHDWRLNLSDQLLGSSPVGPVTRSATKAPRPNPRDTHTSMVSAKTQKRCIICSKQICSRCFCGDAICAPITGRSCYATHLQEVELGHDTDRRQKRSKLHQDVQKTP
jgi:hypothetical protein